MSEEKNENENENGFKVNQWLKDNLRIIVSVIIVVAIAGGIYSYSKRTQPTTTEDLAVIENLTSENDKSTEIVENKESDASKTKPTQQQKEEVKQTAPMTKSSETEKSFVETAARGEGTTHLARRALANYLEKNIDSSLTPAHKIYIEDYLRKNVGFSGRVFVGTSVEFDKELIQKAITEAKKLNEKQLKNLQKYANMVPSLS